MIKNPNPDKPELNKCLMHAARIKLSAVSNQLSAFHESGQYSCYQGELTADS